MRRKLLAVGLAGLLISGILVHRVLSGGGADGGRPVFAQRGREAPDRLPVKQVVLFSSGVGYFQREGEVTGDEAVELSFRVSDVNDLLKSLVVEDLGQGHVHAVNYESQDPAHKILKSFALDLTGNPTFGQILNQARGEGIEVRLQATKEVPARTVKGVVVGIEYKSRPVAAELAGLVAPAAEFLNLTTETGLTSLAMDQVESVKFANPTLQNEFAQALQVLASAHDLQKKSVRVEFAGQGKRHVRVGYVVEQPIWKMTYRLQLKDDGKMHLQGWALVDNTTDNDWQDVNIVLVSGRPISYEMDLYTPLYMPRPRLDYSMLAALLRPPVSAMPDSGIAPNGGMNSFNFAGGGFNIGGFNIGGGFQGGFQGGMPGNAPPTVEPGEARQDSNIGKLTYEELQQRREELKQKLEEAKKAGAIITGMDFQQGVESVAVAEEVGDFLQYHLDEAVSVPRRHSAMLPVLQCDLTGEKVSLFNRDVSKKHPLLAMRFDNSTGKPLTQGPVAIYDHGSYAGDTRVHDVQTGETTVVTYAMDLGVEMISRYETRPGPEMTFEIGTDRMTAVYKDVRTTTYAAKNRTDQDRVLIVEHPLAPDWDLVSPTKKVEKIRNLYRIEVAVAARQTVKLDVVEQQRKVMPCTLASEDGQRVYAVAEGIAVRSLAKAGAAKLHHIEVQDGYLIVDRRQETAITYYVQNNNDLDRAFVIDHLIRPEWTLLTDGKNQPGPGVHRYTLKVPADQTGLQHITEEQVTTDRDETVKQTPVATLREYAQSDAASDAVKKALGKAIQMYEDVQSSNEKLAARRNRLSELQEDQSRLRQNLEIIPRNSEAWKTYLDRFLRQEQQVDQMHEEVGQMRSALEKQQEEYYEYVNKLTVE